MARPRGRPGQGLAAPRQARFAARTASCASRSSVSQKPHQPETPPQMVEIFDLLRRQGSRGAGLQRLASDGRPGHGRRCPGPSSPWPPLRPGIISYGSLTGSQLSFVWCGAGVPPKHPRATGDQELTVRAWAPPCELVLVVCHVSRTLAQTDSIVGFDVRQPRCETISIREAKTLVPGNSERRKSKLQKALRNCARQLVVVEEEVD